MRALCSQPSAIARNSILTGYWARKTFSFTSFTFDLLAAWPLEPSLISLDTQHPSPLSLPLPLQNITLSIDPIATRPPPTTNMIISGFGNSGSTNGNGAGTEFLSMQGPAREALKDYDNTKPHDQQTVPIPQVFRDAMSVREEVFGEQGVPLEAEFDEDDARSWHWVVYASVATVSTPSPPTLSPINKSAQSSKEDEERRASATAQRLPVGTVRLIPPPHGPNKYKNPALAEGDKHPDADPPPRIAADVTKSHPTEPYIKLGRLAILAPYRAMGLSKLLVNTALDYASKHPEDIRPPPSPTTLELASQLGKAVEDAVVWKGLAMVHAQVSVERLWSKCGFTEELLDESGAVEISKEERWNEEGIEHMGMWKRLKLDTGRL